MLAGHLPFFGDTPAEVRRRTRKADYSLSSPFVHQFRFSRFEATGSVPTRDVRRLRGKRAAPSCAAATVNQACRAFRSGACERILAGAEADSGPQWSTVDHSGS